MTSSDWEPAQYNRFAREREQPFWDLAALVESVPSARVVDLGCGDGRLTAALHDRIGAHRTLGIDSSVAMLADSAPYARGDVTFELRDIASWGAGPRDIVFSNAALQWVHGHAQVLEHWRDGLVAGGQLAVQVPANADHPSHEVSSELGREWLGADAPPDPVAANVLSPVQYAELLDRLGFERQSVRLQVYGHRLGSTADVVEWVKGTSLTRFKAVLDDRFDDFVSEYRRRLLEVLGERSPYFYPFKRILLWARLPV